MKHQVDWLKRMECEVAAEFERQASARAEAIKEERLRRHRAQTRAWQIANKERCRVVQNAWKAQNRERVQRRKEAQLARMVRA